jgi:exportin-2 (importin alpha re-exporter)
LLNSLIGLFELPEDTSTGDDEHFIDVEDTPGKNIKKKEKIFF